MVTKPHFENLLLAKPRIVSLTSRRLIPLKFEHKMWIGVVMNSFGTELRNVSDKGSFTPKLQF